MEKAILKTLAYSDIFEYPLKLYEIHKWLVGKKANLSQVETGLVILVKKRRIKSKQGYYFLGRKERLVTIRKRKQKQSEVYFKKARILALLLKLIPWIKLVGISGGLAMSNVQKRDDIDFLIVTGNKRLWLSRLFALSILSLTGQRRKVGENGRKTAGKICVNTLLEEYKLEQKNKDIYLAHEILQMKVLWERDNTYKKYLEGNNWAFKFLPNWVGEETSALKRTKNGKDTTIISIFEQLAKRFQLKIMKPKQGLERLEDGALYFHPLDSRKRILSEYKKRISKFKLSTS